MSENVGGIHYDVTLETAGLIDGQRRVDAATKKAADSLSSVGDAADKASGRFRDAAGRLREANGQFVAVGGAAKTAGDAVRGSGGAFDELNTKLTKVAQGVTLMVAAMAAVKSAQLADEIRLLTARVEVASGSLEAGTAAMAQLVAISRFTQTAVSANVEVFARLNQSLVQMGGTQADTLRVTELLGKAIKVSGASAVEAKAAMLQFGQALGSGKLQGDELRSLMENAPYLMRQLADGIGVPVGALKKLGEEGKLTSDVVVNALGKAASQIESDFSKFPQTVAGAFQVAMDAAERANEKLDQLTGTSAAISGAAKGLGDVLDKLADQFGAVNDQAGAVGRNTAIKTWSDQTKVVLSYVVDAADMTWQALSVLGRNVAFVFTSVGAEIGGIGAQIAAVAKGDFAGAKAIGEAMTADSQQRRAALDAADAKTLANRRLFGEQMRDAWEKGAGGGRGAVNPTKAPSKLKSAAAGDDKEARQLAARAQAAQAYYEGLVADNATALAKIDAEERKALAENQKRAALDKGNQEIYAKARVEIEKKYAKDRYQLEEQGAQQVAELRIATTTDEGLKVELIRAEAMRKVEAAEQVGVMTHAQAERARTLATFNAEKGRAELLERNLRAHAEFAVSTAASQEQRIALVRDETIRQAEAAYRRGSATFAESEAVKVAAVKTSIEQQKALEQARTQTKISTLQVKADSGNPSDQIALIQAQAAAELAANQAAWATDVEARQIYADRRAAIEENLAQRIRDIQVASTTAQFQMMQSSAGQIYSFLQQSGQERTSLGKALFLAERTLAVATILMNTETAASKAGAELGIAGISMASMIRATGYASAATVGAMAVNTAFGGGRQYGGPVNSDSVYRVGEQGPEVFTANGASYMIPGQNGRVISNDQMGGAGAQITLQPTVNVNVMNNSANTQVSAKGSVGANGRIDVDVIVNELVGRAAEGVDSGTGPLYHSIRGRFGLDG